MKLRRNGSPRKPMVRLLLMAGHRRSPCQATAYAYVNDPKRSDKRSPGAKITFELQCTDDIHLSSMTQELKRQWEATGLVEVELDTVTRSGLIQRVLGSVTDRPGFSGDFDATCWRVGGESDPAMMFAPISGPVRTSPLNVSNLHDESITALSTFFTPVQ